MTFPPTYNQSNVVRALIQMEPSEFQAAVKESLAANQHGSVLLVLGSLRDHVKSIDRELASLKDDIRASENAAHLRASIIGIYDEMTIHAHSKGGDKKGTHGDSGDHVIRDMVITNESIDRFETLAQQCIIDAGLEEEAHELSVQRNKTLQLEALLFDEIRAVTPHERQAPYQDTDLYNEWLGIDGVALERVKILIDYILKHHDPNEEVTLDSVGRLFSKNRGRPSLVKIWEVISNNESVISKGTKPKASAIRDSFERSGLLIPDTGNPAGYLLGHLIFLVKIKRSKWLREIFGL